MLVGSYNLLRRFLAIGGAMKLKDTHLMLPFPFHYSKRWWRHFAIPCSNVIGSQPFGTQKFCTASFLMGINPWITILTKEGLLAVRVP